MNWTSGVTLEPTPGSNWTNTSSTTDRIYDYYPVSLSVVVLLSILYGTISFIAVIGNLLVIIAVIKNRSMHTVTNFYIANLSGADVLIGIFSIPFQFQAALLQRWVLPDFLCKLAPFFKELTVNVSILTLTVIAVDRFYALVHPLKPKCTKRVAKIIMAAVWVFSLLSAGPEFYTHRVILDENNIKICWCLLARDDLAVYNKVYRLYLVLIQYFLPLAVVGYSYIRIIRTLWLAQIPGTAVDRRDQILNKNKRKVIKMLIIVVMLFALCWLPLQTYNLASNISGRVNAYHYINIIYLCSNWLAMSNSCYNPVIYALLSEKFKNAFSLLFSPCRCSRIQGLPQHHFKDYDKDRRKMSQSNVDSECQPVTTHLCLNSNGAENKRFLASRNLQTPRWSGATGHLPEETSFV